MADSSLEVIKNIMVCPICSEVLSDARVIRWGHIFCFRCIEQDYEKNRLNKGHCPVCGESYFIKEQQTQYLSNAFVVNDLLDKMKTLSFVCAWCHSGDGISICLKCKLDICKYCSEKTKTLCRHQMVTREYVDSDPFLQDLLLRSKSRQGCPSHPNEDVCHFCQTCKLVMCEYCFNAEHRHHWVEGLKESVAMLVNKNIPHMLENKTQELVTFLRNLEEPRNNDDSVITIWPTDEENRLCVSNRDDCAILQKQMNYLFMYGRDKTILQLFHERENKIDKIMNYKPEREVFYMRDPDTYFKKKHSTTHIEPVDKTQNLQRKLENFDSKLEY
ncbi:E3 ubiquitin-protein ligase TRIM56-like [Ylistrum balloti]|uniref:E3 ubiquitin-protein ligase TRIM56-like n=1 Tax=Ylistrum balloti TaxID=509963 RepID=UPI002905BD8D|nr:E3 ubiquitin-protein ligase TRIM56-like [Ylistrum balloti]